MTRRKIAFILYALALIGGAILVWQVFFPGEKTRIIRRLNSAADAVGIAPGESGPTVIAKLHRLESLLDAEVECRLRFGRERWEGTFERPRALSALAAFRRSGAKVKVGLSEFRVTVSGDSAQVTAEAQADIDSGGGKWKESRQLDVEFGLVRRNGEWLIRRIALRDFMEK